MNKKEEGEKKKENKEQTKTKSIPERGKKKSGTETALVLTEPRNRFSTEENLQSVFVEQFTKHFYIHYGIESL